MNYFTEQSTAHSSRFAVAHYYNLLDELCSENQAPVTAKKMNSFTEQSIAHSSRFAVAHYYNLLDELCSENQAPITARKSRSNHQAHWQQNLDF